LAIAGAVILTVSQFAPAQNSPARGTVVTPASTRGIPGLPHTQLYIFVPERGANPMIPAGETPASIACIYGVTKKTAGCPKNGTVVPTGGTNAIAVLEWGSYPAIESDANTFSSTFGLPAPNITQVCAESSCGDNSGSGWDVEEALDVEWSHAMAPNAAIYVVEFWSENDPISGGAEQKAASLVASAGGGEVSNSWGFNGEWSGELGDDKYLVYSGVVFFASAGDGGPPAMYPSTSPNVVSAGGTTINRDSDGNYTGQSAWGNCNGAGGGGPSAYEPRPSYQNVIKGIVGSARGTPDISADANPCSGVAIYNTSYFGGWGIVGGTSVSSPVLAGITNQAGDFKASTKAELTKTYNEYGNATKYKKYFLNITSGSNGYACTKGWTYCAGIGAPLTPKGE
jgi:subtilase family serine protease